MLSQRADPEAQPINQEHEWVKYMSLQDRMGFVRKVYGVLCVQLLATLAIAIPIAVSSTRWVKGHTWIMYTSLGAMLACMFLMSQSGPETRRFPMNYVFLFTLTAVESIVVGFVSATCTWQSVGLAIVTTVGVFLCVTCFAWFTDDITGYGAYLFTALAVLIVLGMILAVLFWRGIELQWPILGFDLLGVMVFSLYIVYDTQRMIGDWGGHKVQFSVDEYVYASLLLYLDIINLFLFHLGLLGKGIAAAVGVVH